MTQPAATQTESGTQNRITDRLRELIATAKADGPLQRVTVVTPSYYSSFLLRRWLASAGLLNVEFMRIEDLADLLARRKIDAHEGRSLTRLEGAELVRHAVAECAASGDLTGSLSDIANQPSFLTALQRSLSQIESEQPTGLISFDRLADPDQVTQAVGKIWKVYQRLKQEQKLFDRTQVSAWAVEELQNGALETPAMQLSVGKLIVLAVAVPAPQYRSLWKTLADQPALGVLIGATGDERSDALLSEAFGFEASVPDHANAPVTETDAVSAADRRSEVAAIVQRIMAAAAQGTPFNRIAVLYGDPSYASRVRSALILAKIPVSGPPHDPMIASPAGRFVSGILQVASADFARKEVGDWLATCPVKNPETFGESGDSEPVPGVEWDRISKTARVATGAENWKRQLERFAASREFRAKQSERHGADDDSSDGAAQTAVAFKREERQARSLANFMQQLSDDLQMSDETTTWSAWADWLKQIIERYLHSPNESATSESAERINVLVERISELDSLGSSKPDLTRFAAVVIRELSETRSGANRLGKGVFVANIRDAVATRFSHVHIAGMADGTFPSPDTADPLLPDHVRSELNSLFGMNLPLAGVRKELPRRQFLAALMSADNATLYWSRSSGTGTGEAGPAQWLIEQVRKRAGNESVHAGDLLNQRKEIEGLTFAEYGHDDEYSDPHEYEVASIRRHIELQDRRAKHWLEDDEATGIPAALSLDKGRYGTSFTPWSGDLSSTAAAVPSLGDEPLSASRIESFASCPLRYFFGYVLKVEPGVREDDSFHMAADRRGTFIHAALEKYLDLRMAENRPPGDPATLDEAMGEVVKEWNDKEPGANGRVWEIETTEIRRQLRRWLEAEKTLEANGYEPAAAELSFGRASATPDEQLNPLFEVTLEDSTVVQFAGVIDRIDRHPDGGYYVLDYKTGSADPYSKLKDDPVDRGRHMQLALYSKAVQQFMSPEGETLAGYWFVRDRRQRILPGPDQFDPATANQRLHTILESLKNTSESGHFPPNPGIPRRSSFENCGYCDFDNVCPASSRRQRMLQVHSEDPRLAPYFDLALGEDRGTK